MILENEVLLYIHFHSVILQYIFCIINSQNLLSRESLVVPIFLMRKLRDGQRSIPARGRERTYLCIELDESWKLERKATGKG